MKQVVVVGGGFAGIACARGLRSDKRLQVTLISDRPALEYRPMVSRGRGRVANLELSLSLERIFADTPNIKIVDGAVVGIDARRKKVRTRTQEFPYDELVLAIGTVTDYGQVAGLADLSHDVQTGKQARVLQVHLDDVLLTVETPRFVVVGAGLRGVELAAEVAEYCRGASAKSVGVELVEAAPRILPSLPERLSRPVSQRLQELGVKIYTSTTVKGNIATELQLPEDGTQPSSVLWAGGQTHSAVVAGNAKPFGLGAGGKIHVDDHLQADEHIWVAGDCAATEYSGWAGTAAYDGAFIAANIKRNLVHAAPHAYKPPRPTTYVSVGTKWCLADMRSRRFSGYAGWLLRQYSLFLVLKKLLPGRLAWQYLLDCRFS